MAVQFRWCPKCGTQFAAGQKSCGVCGFAIPTAPSASGVGATPGPAGAPPAEVGPAQAAPAPAAPAPTPVAQAAPAPTSVAQAAPIAQAAPAIQQPAPFARPEMPPMLMPPMLMPPAQPAPPTVPWSANPYQRLPPPAEVARPGFAAGASSGLARRGIPMIAVAVIAAIAVVAVVAYVLLSGSGGGSGSIVYSPSTLSCTGQTFSVTMTLPSSVKDSDSLSLSIDGQPWRSGWTAGSAGFIKQSDGSWLVSSTSTDDQASECQLGTGSHHFQITRGGSVVADGSVTIQ
jgi:hypothetical protein